MMHKLLFRNEVPHAKQTPEGFSVTWSGTKFMGILNVTPDSFSDGGLFATKDAALMQAKKMLNEGAFVLDIGGESSRPGADPVSVEAELDRVLPIIRALRELKILVSIDSSKPEVAREALRAGAQIVNDVTGLRDPDMARVCAEAGAPAIIMHMQGEPRTMQLKPMYKDVVSEVANYLQSQAAKALAAGVPSVMLDPGYGFGKSLEHNLDLIRQLDSFTKLPHPVLLGASRKSSIHKMADVPEAKDRDPGSLALHLAAVSKGVAMLRVHNVAAHVQAVKVWEALHAEST